jgi:hypothetical protein
MHVFTIFSLLHYAVFVNASIPHTLALLGVCTKLRKATASFVMHVSLPVRPFVCMKQLVGRIFIKFYILVFFENLSKSVKFY